MSDNLDCLDCFDHNHDNGNQAIAADPSNPKLYGRRCTSLLAAGQHAAALEDAKTLVRLLPDAPVGYLKAARCYRLLNKLKASRTMLEMAIERGADENTIKAVRTEQRKLQEDRLRLLQDRSRPFIDILPEEIFLEIASYLPQRDLIRASQVSQRWRTALHSRPQLWTTMYLHIPKYKCKSQNTHFKKIDDQIRFYEDRLPAAAVSSSSSFSSSLATDGRLLALKHLSVHSANPDLNGASLPWLHIPKFRALLWGSHRFTRALQSFAISNVPGEFAEQWLDMLCGPCSSPTSSISSFSSSSSSTPPENSTNAHETEVISTKTLCNCAITLQALRFATTTPLNTWTYLNDYPNLKVLEKFQDMRSAESDPNWPWIGLCGGSPPSSAASTPSSSSSSGPSTALARSSRDERANLLPLAPSNASRSDQQHQDGAVIPLFSIQRFVAQGQLAIGAAGFGGSPAGPSSPGFDNLTHLSFGGGSTFSFFFTHSQMTQLCHLSLNNALFLPGFTLPPGIAPFDVTLEDGLLLDSILNTPLDLPNLETLELIYSDNMSPSGWAATTRTRLRPSIYLSRLKAPKLRTLKIDNFGSIVAPSSLRSALPGGAEELQSTAAAAAATVASREKGTWLRFCREHGETLEEIIINKTSIPHSELLESLSYLSNLRKLSLSSIELPPNFLKAATSPHLPLLQHFAVSYCSNITSGDLVRLVQSKNQQEPNQMKVLEIEGCTDLQKEVVDWCRKVIPKVGWVGWGNKNETRNFGFR